jgi:hypothetical protein
MQHSIVTNIQINNIVAELKQSILIIFHKYMCFKILIEYYHFIDQSEQNSIQNTFYKVYKSFIVSKFNKDLIKREKINILTNIRKIVSEETKTYVLVKIIIKIMLKLNI